MKYYQPKNSDYAPKSGLYKNKNHNRKRFYMLYNIIVLGQKTKEHAKFTLDFENLLWT
jgi:hypothetical protein